MDPDIINVNPVRSTHHLNLLFLLIPIITFIITLALLTSRLNKQSVAGVNDTKVTETGTQSLDK
jgi:hypothetical protein